MRTINFTILIIILVSVLILSPFSTFTEISEHSIVSGVAIDKESDEWLVTCEISVPSSSNDFASEARYVNGKGYTLYSALEDCALKTPEIIYTEAVQIYLINEKINKDNCIYQYFRDGNVNLRAIAVSTKGKASDLFSDDENKGVKSVKIAEKIKNYCNDNKIEMPDITAFLQDKKEILISDENIPLRRAYEHE